MNSIAVRLQVRVSRFVRLAQLLTSGNLLLLAALLATNELTWLSHEARYCLALLQASLALVWLLKSWAAIPTCTINISPDGELVIAIGQQAMQSAYLLPGSTFWPGFMLLRLRTADGKTWQLPVFHDSVGTQEFRALAIALRWIVRRKHAQHTDLHEI